MNTIETAETSLYDLLKEAGCEIDHWQSDLYVLATQQARTIIKEYQDEGHTAKATVFRSKLDGCNWIELPFHYMPHWTSRMKQDDRTMAPAI